MISITVNAQGTRDALKGYIANLTQELPTLVSQAADDTAAFARTHQSSGVRPFTSRTGKLLGSIQPRMGRIGSGVVSAQVRATAPYALFVHDGTRAHTITARRARFLRFEIGGVVHFRRSVRHPGTRPYPYMLDPQRWGEKNLDFQVCGLLERLSRR